jgi:hypothetical protein
MTPWQKRSTALTRRMAEDMQLRNFSPKTIDAYTYHVSRGAVWGVPGELARTRDPRRRAIVSTAPDQRTKSRLEHLQPGSLRATAGTARSGFELPLG